MFVQISPSATHLGYSRVRGIEHGPAQKQTNITELHKYKQVAEKAKHDDKETKKLQDSLQSLQLRLGAREHICRTLQEKVRDLENKLEEKRKTRLKQENRALAAVTFQAPPPAISASNQSQNRPPLSPSNASKGIYVAGKVIGGEEGKKLVVISRSSFWRSLVALRSHLVQDKNLYRGFRAFSMFRVMV